MDNSLGSGFMAIFAVSGSVVFLAMQVHKRLLSDFMKKMEFEIGHATGSVKDQEPKKKVRFADDVVQVSSEDRKACGKKYLQKAISQNNGENIDGLPLNWQALYKGILQYRNIKEPVKELATAPLHAMPLIVLLLLLFAPLSTYLKHSAFFNIHLNLFLLQPEKINFENVGLWSFFLVYASIGECRSFTGGSWDIGYRA
ncbi:Uncharacterized protein Fot_07774 [Forsythia ovata]|uniref:Uncharacterized protein n=1 Tax=Forsythia ovata TaxID=205694 RepID=A0ABD1WXJ2_9LAMI